jgi:hypothetical protein
MLGWTVEVRDSTLARVGQLSENDLTEFLAIPRMNSLGSWSIKLPNTVLNESGVRVPHSLCAVLRTQGSGVIFTGPHGVVLTGPMTFAEMEATSDDPSGQWEIQGTSDLVEIAKSLAYPQPSNSSVSSQSVSNDVRSGLGEALMRAYISSNIGPTASAARKLSDLTLSADGGLGISLSKSPRFQNLLELTQEIALGSDLLFDVVQVADGREFRVSAPQDVSSLVRWDIANNQLSKSKYGYSAPGVTRVFVAGQGEGSARTIVEVTTPASLLSEAIWGRIERFVDQRNTDDISELTQAGLEVLATEGTTVTSLEVVPSSAMADGFGTTWFLGSWVTVVVNDQQIRAQVVEVPISITSSDGVLVGAVVGDATGFDWQAILAAKQSKTEKRVSALEQNAENTVAAINEVMNGALTIWERGPGPFAPDNYSADRFWFSGANAVTASRDTDTPGFGSASLKWTTTGANSYGSFYVAFERDEVLGFRGITKTVSVSIKSGGTFTGLMNLAVHYSSSTDLLVSVQTLLSISEVAVTGIWKRFDVTFTVPSDALGLRIGVYPSQEQSSGASLTATAFQMEEGSRMTTFIEPAGGIAGQLAACQRFFQNVSHVYSTCASGGFGNSYANRQAYGVTMRATPTLTIYSGAGFSGTVGSASWYGGGNNAVAAVTPELSNVNGHSILRAGVSGNSLVLYSYRASADL